MCPHYKEPSLEEESKGINIGKAITTNSLTGGAELTVEGLEKGYLRSIKKCEECYKMRELPSDKIFRYAKEMRSSDWIAFGGNRYTQEKWEEMHSIDEYKENYFIKALLRYLDESHDH